MFRKKLSSKEIMKAAENGEDATIRAQLKNLTKEEAKKLVNTSNEDKETALHIAAGSGHLNFVNLLIEYGANPNAIGIFKETPLHRAAAKNYEEIMQSLINAGGNLDISRHDSSKPIHVAASNDAIKVIKVIIANDPSQANAISKECRTPLFYAGNEDTKNVLINAGTTGSYNYNGFSK